MCIRDSFSPPIHLLIPISHRQLSIIYTYYFQSLVGTISNIARPTGKAFLWTRYTCFSPYPYRQFPQTIFHAQYITTREYSLNSSYHYSVNCIKSHKHFFSSTHSESIPLAIKSSFHHIRCSITSNTYTLIFQQQFHYKHHLSMHRTQSKVQFKSPRPSHLEKAWA